MRTLLSDDVEKFSGLTDALLELLSKSFARIDATRLAKRGDQALALLAELDALEQKTRLHVSLAQEHQNLQRQIDALQSDLVARERLTQAAIVHLDLCRQTLASTCRDGRVHLERIRKAESRAFCLSK